MPNYKNGKIYSVRCYNDDTLIYIGSTTQSLSKRWGDHKDSFKTGNRLPFHKLIIVKIKSDWKKKNLKSCVIFLHSMEL